MSKPFLLFLIFLSTIACSRYPTDIEWILKLAEKNRSELEKVLEHYNQRSEDSLKYRAACFLIANMSGHCA